MGKESQKVKRKKIALLKRVNVIQGQVQGRLGGDIK